MLICTLVLFASFIRLLCKLVFYVDKYWNKLYSQETVTVRGVPMGLPRYYKKKLDYDGFLSYDANKEVNLEKSVLKAHEDYIKFLLDGVSKGDFSFHELNLEFDSLLTQSRLDSNLVRDCNMNAKFAKKSRGSL